MCGKLLKIQKKINYLNNDLIKVIFQYFEFVITIDINSIS